MSRILLVDDSPHAQRMGERILSEEGFQVVTVSNGDSALIRLEDVDPDVVMADAVMPGRTGYDLCYFLKMSPRHRHVRVILTVGAMESLDPEQVKRVQADGTVRKPFEATGLLAVVRPLAEAAVQERPRGGEGAPKPVSRTSFEASAAPFVTVVDAEQVRAAVTVALDASMAAIAEEISQRVLAALNARRPEGRAMEPLARTEAGDAPRAAISPQAFGPESVLPPAEFAKPHAPRPEPPKPALPAAESLRMEPVRRVNPLRFRPASLPGQSQSAPSSLPARVARDAPPESANPEPEQAQPLPQTAAPAPAPHDLPGLALPDAPATFVAPARRLGSTRLRAGSIFGLDQPYAPPEPAGKPEPPESES